MAGLQYLLLGVQTRAQRKAQTAQSARVMEFYLPAHDGHMLIMCDVLFNLKGYGGGLHSLEQWNLRYDNDRITSIRCGASVLSR